MYQAIRLTPGMDYASLVSTANENFTNLENQTDIYHTVGEQAFLTPTVGAGSPITAETLTIPHNLGVIPRYDIFVTAFNRFSGGTITGFPTEFLIPMNFALQTFSTSFVMNYFLAVDKDNMYITRTGQNTTGSSAAVPAVSVYYYVYREIVED